MAKLTVISHGMGQDSTTILEEYINNPEFRAEYAPEDLVVIFSETGDEHDETYVHLARTRERCYALGIKFVHLQLGLGFHTGDWAGGLRGFYRAKNAVGSKAFPKTCTDKLKLNPIYKFLDQYVGYNYGFEHGRKKALYSFAKKYGKIDVLVGIAAGEEKRMADPSKDPNKWKRETINIRYPLIDLGLDRQGCQERIAHYGQPVPPPSNCKLCPFMSLQELLYMWRFMPEDYYDWVDIEATKLKHNEHMGERNLGVWGKDPLPVMLKKAIDQFGHMSNTELREYKYSHGHCVASKY